METTIALLTDFGNRDSYVAEMKAVILSKEPSARLIDISHEVPAFDVRSAAFLLLRSYRFFPKGTYFVVVVDPGVGSQRKSLHIKVGDYHFVGPDNGVLSWAVQDGCLRYSCEPVIEQIEQPAGLSTTFHGRDLFAPFAVDNVKGTLQQKRLDNFECLPLPTFRKNGNQLFAQVILQDHFGNVVTSVPHSEPIQQARAEGSQTHYVTAQCYADIADTKVALIAGSHGYWELACGQASAADKTGLHPGDTVIFDI